jgi:hypothetical protein
MGISAVQNAAASPVDIWSRTINRSTNTAPAAANSSTATSQEDVIDISQEGQAASEAANPLLGRMGMLYGIDTSDGVITLDELQEAQNRIHDALSQKLGSALRKAGIDTSREIRLQVASDGSVVVVNDHPQKAEIEKLFTDDPQLRNQYVEYTSISETISAINEGMAFQRAYAKNPQAAVEQYWYLFDSAMRQTTTVSVLDGQIKAFQQRPGGQPQAIDE